MASPGGQNGIPSPRAPSIAPSIRSASSINHALLNQLARPSPSPTKSPAALTLGLQDVSRGASGLDIHSARRVRVPYAFPATASQRASAEMERKEQRFKNLIVLALVLVAAGSVGQYCAAAEAGADARMYAAVLARATHKREWDLACFKESRGKARERLTPPLDSPPNGATRDEAGDIDENSQVPSDEEEIPYLVDLRVKQDRTEGDLSRCANDARVAITAMASMLKWFEDSPSPDAEGEDDDGEDDDGTRSQASNPFLESSNPGPPVQPSPVQEEEDEDEQQASLEQLLKLFTTNAQLSILVPYSSGDFDAPNELFSSTHAPIKHVLHNEMERLKAALPVDHDRVKKELEEAHAKARKSEKTWCHRRDDAARRAVVCLATVAQAVASHLEEDEEESEGEDGEDSDDNDEGLSVKAAFLVTLAVVQATLAVCLVSDKRHSEADDYTYTYPSAISIPCSSGTASREKLMLDLARAQKESRVSKARWERELETRKRSVRAGLANVVCKTVIAIWKHIAPEAQVGEWESDLAFWSDMKGLEDDEAERADEENGEFDELERKALAALKLMGLATFKLFDNLYKEIDFWKRSTNANAAGVEGAGDDEQDENEDEVEHLGPERMGKLSGSEKISSWLQNVSSPTPQGLNALEEPRAGGSQPSPLQIIRDAKQRGEANLLALQRHIEEDTSQYLRDAEEQMKAMKERGLKRKFPTSANQEGGEEDHEAEGMQGGEAPGGTGADAEEPPADEGNKENIPTDDPPRPPKKQKQSANAKIASLWKGPKRRVSAAKKEASMKALEKARESIALKKQQQLANEQARVERARVKEEERRRREAAGEPEPPKKRKEYSLSKRKGRSKAQKESLAKAMEAAKVKRARAGQA